MKDDLETVISSESIFREVKMKIQKLEINETELGECEIKIENGNFYVTCNTRKVKFEKNQIVSIVLDQLNASAVFEFLISSKRAIVVKVMEQRNYWHFQNVVKSEYPSLYRDSVNAKFISMDAKFRNGHKRKWTHDDPIWEERMKKVKYRQNMSMNCQVEGSVRMYQIFKRQSPAMEFMEKCLYHSNPLLFCFQNSSNGIRQFLVTEIDGFIEKYDTEFTSYHCYEIIHQDAPCRLYFDLGRNMES